ncbi:MAG: geranylgeranyl reductase family protein [Thermoplasmata archaeon]|nr:geranylgeranyl reductase family protein [Thermoplasmata archaeon]
MIHDIAIIGAGPAGAMAASKLDELGVDYILLDKAEFPRNKPCAGVLSPKIHSLVQIPEEVIDRKLVGYRVHGPPDAIVESKFPEPGCIVQRSIFDNYLIERLKTKPVINQASEIKDEGEHYLIKGRTEDIKARFIIGADGTGSIARKFIGSKSSKIAISAQYEFSLDEEKVSQRVGNWFEVFYLMEYGYGWLSPMKDGMKIGIGILADKKPDIWGMLDKFLDNSLISPKIHQATLINKEAHSIPMSGPLDTLSSGRILLTGDAGGFVYPGTGEGIYYAMKSGQIAAELAYENLANQTNLDDEYNKRLEAAGLLSLRDADFIEKNLASPEHAEKYVKRLKFLASRS